MPISNGGFTKKEREQQLRFETEDDLRTLRRAREIMNDKDRSKRVRAMVVEERKALKELDV